jgi:hypothetical protein
MSKLKCKKHPAYKSSHKPTGLCEDCWRIYTTKHNPQKQKLKDIIDSLNTKQLKQFKILHNFWEIVKAVQEDQKIIMVDDKGREVYNHISDFNFMEKISILYHKHHNMKYVFYIIVDDISF